MSRVLLASLVAAAVFAIAQLLEFGNDFPWLLAESAFLLTFIRFHRDREVALGLLVIGLYLFGSGIRAGFLAPHSLAAVMSLDPSTPLKWRSATTAGYAFLLCSAGSYAWSVLGGAPMTAAPRWRRTPLSVESEAPDHVIHVDRTRND
ncbi:hypothetical protein [Dokdonella sp.]|uniref:hypothetical protein n=1 Tax=Dokdonella sp. TaxID=2291710 RepID=UPI001B29D29E|nr:hypothetical protein [Dokdonella sp.]MBO9664590.1 hypothetical protein [Dokdonella sp.]